MQRHGPAVLGVCRRVLGNAADADDAFQATFLVLLRKAGSVGRRPSLGCWLYGVASRVAAKARCRRAPSPLPGDVFAAPGADPAARAGYRELVALLDEEVRALPEKYRAALVVCGLGGKTCEQAARELGWAKSTVTHRLTRARELLRRRLSRRGVTVPAALLSAALAQEAAASYVPALLALATVRLVRQAVTGRIAEGPAVALAEAVVKRASARWAVVLGLAAALGLAAGAAASRQEKEPAAAPTTAAAPVAPGPHVDREGFPLPAEAVARVGSARFRYGRWIGNLDYSPDGTLLASSGEGGVWVWDARTGKVVRRFTVSEHRWARDGLFSADGKTVVLVDGDTCRWLDVHTGREVRSCSVKFSGRRSSTRLGPHGEMLAIAGERPGNDLVVYDLPSGRERCRIAAKAAFFGEVAFSPDGTKLAVLEWGNNSRVRLFLTTTGRTLGEFDAGGRLSGLSFSADGKQLLACDRKTRVTVWSVPAGEVSHRLEVKVNALVTAAFAPDGKSVVAGSQDLDAVQIELATGKELHRFRVYPSSTCLGFTPDGKALAVGTADGSISQWDLATGQRLAASADSIPALGSMWFSADGKQLEVWAGALTAVDWRSGREVRRLELAHQGMTWVVALSADRTRVAGLNAARKATIWDARSGKELREVAAEPGWCRPAFSPDGKTLYTGEWDSPVRAWDLETGKERPAFDNQHRRLFALAASRDGRWLAAADHPQAAGGARLEVAVWDLSAGGEPRKFLPRPGTVRTWALAFSPDGGRLAAVGGEPYKEKGTGQAFVALWDLRDGGEKFIATVPGAALMSVAFSPDGRLLATGGKDGAVRLWETATARERHCFTGHQDTAFGVTFSPDGKLLASSSADAPVFVWDVEGCYGKPPSAVPFAEGEGKGLWDALDSADAAAAFGAMRQLLARPGPAVALLRQHLRPAPAIDEKTLQGLLEELDAADFAAREKASKDLEALADRAAPLLRKALAGNASAEARRRIPPLLEAAAPAAPERRREVRAVEVLERLGTGGARELLAALAGGDKEALLTREARAALGRLAGH